MATTAFLFRSDSYLRETDAIVTGLGPDGGIELDRTVFYAASGGQPGDSGMLVLPNGATLPVANSIHPDGDKTRIVHVANAAAGNLPAVGDQVRCSLDWERRYKLMRMHTALHLLSVALPFPVTGGSIGEEKGRLDFDMDEVPGDVAALEVLLNGFVAADHKVSEEWIGEDELDANPDLVKTMNVKPPRGQGRIRLIRIGSGESSIDLQPCGGTHVRALGEIGALRIGKIEKKGRANRRVALHFVEQSST